MTGDKRWERRTYHWRLRHTEASREDKDIIRRGEQNKLVGGKSMRCGQGVRFAI